jgi:N-acetyltransferase 10
VCLEGAISKQTALASLSKGVRHAGDLIPWVVSQQFQDDDFATLNGARVVRIATHPDYTGMGYGRHALEQLEQYYLGKFVALDEDAGSVDDSSKFEVKRVKDEELEVF